MFTYQLTYEDRKKMIDYLMEKVKEEGGKPLAIAICDGAKDLISLTMMDGIATRSARFAECKAYTAALMQRTTDSWAAHLKKEDLTTAAFCDPKMTYLKGGTPIFTQDGVLIGSIGISGWTEEGDQELADLAAGLIQK